MMLSIVLETKVGDSRTKYKVLVLVLTKCLVYVTDLITTTFDLFQLTVFLGVISGLGRLFQKWTSRIFSNSPSNFCSYHSYITFSVQNSRNGNKIEPTMTKKWRSKNKNNSETREHWLPSPPTNAADTHTAWQTDAERHNTFSAR